MKASDGLMWLRLPFFSSSDVLCVAASALASASPCFCSVLFLLPPSEQAQHFKSCFPTAGKQSRSVKSSHRMDFPSNIAFLNVAPNIHEVFATLASVFCPSSFLWRQTSLGTMDLGQVYYEPLKDRQGNILLVTLKDVLNASRWEKFTV